MGEWCEPEVYSCNNALNRRNIQYSFRLALPVNTAYFFNTARYQLIVFSCRATADSDPKTVGTTPPHDAMEQVVPICRPVSPSPSSVQPSISSSSRRPLSAEPESSSVGDAWRVCLVR